MKIKRFGFVSGALVTCVAALVACGDDANPDNVLPGGQDAGIEDSSSKPDTSVVDSGKTDAGSSDTGVSDAVAVDSSVADSGPIDSGVPGIVLSALTSASTTENLGTATFTVALATAPTSTVTIAVSSSNLAEGTVSPATLTFTPSNFATPQTVTVTGVDDDVDDGDVGYEVVFAPATSSDANYAGKQISPIALTNINNDTAGFTVSAPSGTATSEKGTTQTFTVKLKTKPTADVTFPVTSSLTTEGTASPSSLVFTAANYAIEQTVTVTGVDDSVVDGDKDYTITVGPSTSSDAKYAGLQSAVNLRNTDDEVPIVAVQGRWSGFCAQFADGKLKCWGRNDGELGIGATGHRGDGANEMGDNLPFVNLGTGRTVAALGVGGRAEQWQCAVLDNASVKCWGNNGSGTTGVGDTVSRGATASSMGDNLPVVQLGTGRTAKQLANSYGHACAVLDNNTVKCWGNNDYGKLGLGDTATRGDSANEMGDNLPAVNLGTGRTAKAVAVGGTFSCALLDNNTVKCWGDGRYGNLGSGDTVIRGDNANEMGDNLPTVSLGTGRTAVQILADEDMACAILDNGALKCWGHNVNGSLGLGDTNVRGTTAASMGDNLPAVNLGTGRTVKQLSLGSLQACAVLDNNTVKCWGSNNNGQLGLGDTNPRGDNANEMGDNLPIVNLGTGRTAKFVSVGTSAACAVLDNGALKCWGYNGYGGLGLGDTTTRGTSSSQMGDNLPAVKLVGP